MGRDAGEFFRELRERDPALQAEYERLKPRFDLVDEVIRARKKAKLTQKELGALVGVSQGVIARLESAEHSPRLETVVDIARALGYRLDVKLVRDKSLASQPSEPLPLPERAPRKSSRAKAPSRRAS